MKMTLDQIAEFHRLCGIVLASAKGGLADYAKSYAKAGKHMYTGQEIQGQIPYVLSNLAHWRGEVAQATKKGLKALMQEAS